jgi:hypothetical protein
MTRKQFMEWAHAVGLKTAQSLAVCNGVRSTIVQLWSCGFTGKDGE